MKKLLSVPNCRVCINVCRNFVGDFSILPKTLLTNYTPYCLILGKLPIIKETPPNTLYPSAIQTGTKAVLFHTACSFFRLCFHIIMFTFVIDTLFYQVSCLLVMLLFVFNLVIYVLPVCNLFN